MPDYLFYVCQVFLWRRTKKKDTCFMLSSLGGLIGFCLSFWQVLNGNSILAGNGGGMGVDPFNDSAYHHKTKFCRLFDVRT